MNPMPFRKLVVLSALAVSVAGCSPDHHTAAVPSSEAPKKAEPAVVDRVPDASVVSMDKGMDALVAPNTPIAKVASGFVFTEGPMWRGGRLWFSDLKGNKMYAVSPTGEVQLLIDHAGGLENPPAGGFVGSNAMATDKDGSVLMLQHGLRRIVRLDDNMKITPFIDKYEGKRLNSPNDLVFAPDGSLWFTDPPFGLPGQNKDPAKEIPFNGVYRYADGKLTAVIKDLPTPNGIGFSADGKKLYISNSGPKMFVMRYDVGPNGTVSHPTKFIEYPDKTVPDVPDGLKLDSAGNLWTSGPGGIRIINPQGKVLGQIKLPEVAANLAWADGGKTLYLTGSTSIYRFPVLTPGQMPLYQR